MRAVAKSPGRLKRAADMGHRAATRWASALLAAAAMLSPVAATAQAEPPRRAWAAPDTDSQGHEQVRALAAALGADRIRIEPSASHISRLRMLRDGRVQLAATSVTGSFFAQEGLFAYAAADIGPQPVRIVLTNMSTQLLGIAVAADAGIASVADLKGKRVVQVSGSPELRQHLSGLLAHGGLDWNDVKVVPVNGYRAAVEAVIANRADAMFAASSSPDLQKLAKSPRGLSWPVVAHADQLGWERLRQFTPYLLPVDATEGAGLSDKAPVESTNWPYPVLITLARRSAEEVYQTTRELITRYRSYRDQAPGNAGWDARRQPFSWAIPWHDGAIKAFREQGVWTDAHQAHNDGLVRRQQILREAWDALLREAIMKADDEKPDEAAWLSARAHALRKAGLDSLMSETPLTPAPASKP